MVIYMWSSILSFFRGFWSSQGFFRDEERSLGFGVLRIGGYIIMVHAFIGGFLVSPDVAWIKMKNLCYQGCHFGYRQGFKHNCRIFFLPCRVSFHALILCIVYFYGMHMEEVNSLIQFLLFW